MSIIAENAAYNLPPNVQGKSRGSLELTILDVNCSSPCSSSSSSSNAKGRNPINFIGSGGFTIKFIWWGQNYANGAVARYNSAQKPTKESSPASPHVVYSIKTNSKLFQNYLINCEPIELKLTASTSNLQVGTAYVKISKTLVDKCTEGELEENHAVKIFSPRNTTIGEIKLKLKMLFSSRNLDSVRLSQPDQPSRDDHDLNLPTVLDTARSYKSFKSEYSSVSKQAQRKSGRPTSTTTLSSHVLDYLTGREMSRDEQSRALEEIQNTSPLESVITELTNRLNIPSRDIYNRIDSLRLTVRSITLLPAGLRELDTPQLDTTSFSIESRISPNLVNNIQAKYDYDVIRFYSEHVDVHDKRVDFNRDTIRSIKITPYVENAFLQFTIWSRKFGSKYSRCLGTAKFQFASLFASAELEEVKKLTIRSCTDKIQVGYAIVKVTLGTKGVHFGSDFMTIINDNNLNECTIERERTSPSFCDCENMIPRLGKVQMPLRNFNNNETNNTNSTKSNSTSCSKNIDEKMSEITQKHNSVDENDTGSYRKEKEKMHSIETDKKEEPQSQRLLQGLLYVGSIRNVRELKNGGYFLVCRAFWKEDATSTEFCQNNNFNFFEIFPVINNEMFLERTRNNHLILELWQKFTDTTEQLVGIVKLPLHQFFIAFRDNVITNHLCQARLPVISIDGWVSITSPLTGEACGQLQTLLAIGTEEQLEYLKVSRGLTMNRVCENIYLNTTDFQIPVPQSVPVQKTERSLSSCDAESQTTFEESQENATASARRERLSDLLGCFIDNLAQRLPTDRAQVKETVSDSTSVCPNQGAAGPQIRKTSDLLDALQKALVTPPVNATPAATSAINMNLFKAPAPVEQSPKNSSFVKILLEIESALHLPRNPVKLGNKKIVKRNNNTGKCKQSRFTVDEEPSPYVTFQAEEGCGQMVKSHEGMVYATNVVERSCNPVWNKRFEIFVAADLMTNDEKRFILKVWRKTATDLPQCRLLPTPIEDVIVGFAAIDLNVLLARMPCIAGWFNIVDFNGRINGQIKVNVRPLEDVMKFKEPSVSKTIPADLINAPHNIKPPATGIDLNNTTLSRAIKRKFTELEEITERLRARLLDVTGEVENPPSEEIVDAEVIDAQLDEFERDLNTVCDEDEEIERLDDFGWLGLTENLSGVGDESDSATSDSHERIQMISEYLRKTDLNHDTEALFTTRERNPPEEDTASNSNKKHID